MIISRNLADGEIRSWPTAEAASRQLDLEPKSIRSVCDKPRHYHGFQFISQAAAGDPGRAVYWRPPAGLQIETAGRLDQSIAYIVGVSIDDGSRVVYNNPGAAARLRHTDESPFTRDKLRFKIGSGKPYGGFVWSTLPADEVDVFDAEPVDVSALVHLVTAPDSTRAKTTKATKSSKSARPADSPPGGSAGESAGAVRIFTQKIHSANPPDEHEGVVAAAAALGVGPERVQERLSQPMQLCGRVVWREGKRHWVPPANFVFRTCDEAGAPLLFEKRGDPASYITATTDDGVATMYESVKAAAQLTGANRGDIAYAVDKGMRRRQRVWTSVDPASFVFV